jgi:hypothetical protein
MPYDKDLRDLLKATKKVARPVPKTVKERLEKTGHESSRDTEASSASSDRQQLTS